MAVGRIQAKAIIKQATLTVMMMIDDNDNDDESYDDYNELQFAEGQYCTLIGLLSSFAESWQVVKWRQRHLVSIWLLSIFYFQL